MSPDMGATSEYLTIVALGTAAFSLLWRFILEVFHLTCFIEIGKSIYRAALSFSQLGSLSGTLPVSGQGWTSHSSPDPDCAKAVGVLDVGLDVSECLCRVYLARQTTFHRRILNVFLGKLYVLVN